MWNKLLKGAAIFLLVFLFLGPINGNAQCAMCRATVESNIKNETSTVGKGLNKGILYLMSIPYVLAGTFGFFWYRHRKRTKNK